MKYILYHRLDLLFIAVLSPKLRKKLLEHEIIKNGFVYRQAISLLPCRDDDGTERAVFPAFIPDFFLFQM